MLRHYIISAYRSVVRHTASFWINTIGLSTGMATSLLIILWVADELGKDKFHLMDDQLYQVMATRELSNGQLVTSMSTFGQLAAELEGQFPEIQKAATYTRGREHLLSAGKVKVGQEGIYASPSFLEITSFKLLHGAVEHALADPASIVLSRSVAAKLFQDPAKAFDQTVILDSYRSYKVSAILDDIPKESSRTFDFIIPFDDVHRREPLRATASSMYGPRTIVLLGSGPKVETINAKIEQWQGQSSKLGQGQFSLVKMSSLYLRNDFENGKQAGGRIENVRLFALVALFILLIACINFINLSTARASKRAHDVGIRKAVGAERPMLIKQYFSESIVVTIISMFFALAIVSLVLPKFNELAGKAIEFRFTFELIAGTLGITLFTGLLAGSYPALYLSSYRAIQIIKGEFRSSPRQIWIRKGLVVFQFWLSIIFIAAVVVIQSQIRFIADQDGGQNNLVYYEQVAHLSGYAAALAIVISCLGLLGLAAFTAERRVREIGIRKALGASAVQIVWLITGEFTRLVAWAILFGIPVAYVILRRWLDQFEYRIELSLVFFLWSAMIAILISWITLGTQAIRTALINPSDCLREE